MEVTYHKLARQLSAKSCHMSIQNILAGALPLRVGVVSEMTYTVSSGTLNSTIPYLRVG